MYKPNKRHLQPPLISNIHDLPTKHQERLEQSWAGQFYREFFSRLNEEAFAVLYADCPSRPNIPVNVLVGLETLKSGFGWSDEELYDHFVFDMQVRFALGYHNLKEGEFELRSLYNFRRKLSQYNLEHGTNLLVRAFEAITDQQIIAFSVQSTHQRMDSAQIASNILDASRLQLAAECVQRVARVLSVEDQATYAELLAPYLKDTINQYVYRIKGKEQVQAHLGEIGQILYRLLSELKERYRDEHCLAVVERFFLENYRVVDESVQAKAGQELSSGCLQSLDDLEASYRQKGQRFYKGYVVNASETCHPENELQLITQVQVAANNVADSQLMLEALPNLAARTELKELYTDGAYGSPQADPVLREHGVKQIQSAIRGTRLTPHKLHLSEYEIQQDAQGAPTRITCPYGQSVAVTPTPSRHGYLAGFDPATCLQCPFHAESQCRVFPRKRSGKLQMDFTQEEVDAAQRRRTAVQNQRKPKNLRAAVEATMRCLKHPFPAAKVPVRGLFRVTCLMIGAAAMTNIRRIWRYQMAKRCREMAQNFLFFALFQPTWRSQPSAWILY